MNTTLTLRIVEALWKLREKYMQRFNKYDFTNDSKINFRVFPIEVKSSKNYTVTSLG